MGRKRTDAGPEREQPAVRIERACVLDPHCLQDLEWWAKENPRVLVKALDLMKHVLRDPFMGPGKPEPLKGLGPNTWSRRITGEHRLVYLVFNDRVSFIQARYHY